MSEVAHRRRRRRAGRARARRSPARRASTCTPSRWRRASGRMSESSEPPQPTSTATTGETDIRLRSPRRHGRRNPHDRRRLPRPHARPARPPRAAGPRRRREAATCRPGRITPSRTPGSCWARRSTEALGDRRRDHPLRPRRRPDGRGARRRARSDISGRPLLVWEGVAVCRRASTGGFEHELAEEFLRAVASTARLHAAHHAGDRHERAPPDRGGVQGVRAGAARRDEHRSDRDGRAVDQGDPDGMMARLRLAWEMARGAISPGLERFVS